MKECPPNNTPLFPKKGFFAEHNWVDKLATLIFPFGEDNMYTNFYPYFIDIELDMFISNKNSERETLCWTCSSRKLTTLIFSGKGYRGECL